MYPQEESDRKLAVDIAVIMLPVLKDVFSCFQAKSEGEYQPGTSPYCLPYPVADIFA